VAERSARQALRIVRLTCQPEMVTPRCLSTVVILNIIKSGAYQQDRYQQRPLINVVDSWYAGQDMRCCMCNSNSNVLVCATQGSVCMCMGESVSE
jgi:hypothetical protein